MLADASACAFLTAEYAQKALDDEQELLDSREETICREEKETWPDGRETWVSTTKAPLLDKSGDIVGTFGVSHDITARKQWEQAMHEANRAAEATAAPTIHSRMTVAYVNAVSMIGFIFLPLNSVPATPE